MASRAGLAREASLSADQMKNALRVANVLAASFEQQVESASARRAAASAGRASRL